MNITVEKVGRKHSCNKCKKIMLTRELRITTFSGRYCFVCGYNFARKQAKEWKESVEYLRNNYLKEIIADRMDGYYGKQK